MARFYDGVTADVTEVICRVDGSRQAGTLAIVELATRRVLARWPAKDVFPVHGRRRELKIGAIGQPGGARLWVVGPDLARANDLLPALGHRRRGDTARQWQLAGLSTAALAVVLGVYLFGVPLLAARLVWLVPQHLEETLGNTAGDQMEASLGEGGNFRVCDPNPNSIANKAISRFGKAAIQGSGSRSMSISPLSIPTFPMLSRCRVGGCITSRPCSMRRKRPTSSPGSYPMRSATSFTDTACSN